MHGLPSLFVFSHLDACFSGVLTGIASAHIRMREELRTLCWCLYVACWGALDDRFNKLLGSPWWKNQYILLTYLNLCPVKTTIVNGKWRTPQDDAKDRTVRHSLVSSFIQGSCYGPDIG